MGFALLYSARWEQNTSRFFMGFLGTGIILDRGWKAISFFLYFFFSVLLLYHTKDPDVSSGHNKECEKKILEKRPCRTGNNTDWFFGFLLLW